ncbi:MAG: hypothetical protein HZA04_06665 [Nitrospinae bacterium]|nr:hypothetical protein [Nitrospinota bacterium]
MAFNPKDKRPLGRLEFSLVSLAALLAGIFFVTGNCATPQYNYAPPTYRAVPTFTDIYNWPKYTPPEAAKPASVPLTVIIVDPEHNQTLKVGNAVTMEMIKVFNSFSSSMGQDFEAVMVAKGMTAKGPFEYYDEITYTDKFTSDLIVQAIIVFDINDLTPMEAGGYGALKSELFENGQYGKVRYGKMSIGAKVYYYMYEPLSKEKMWVKKLDLGTEEFEYEMAYKQKQEAYESYQTDECGGGRYVTQYKMVDTAETLYDTKPYLLAKKLKHEYGKIMEAGWTYFNVEEMKNMKARTLDIRQRKQY